MHRNESGLFYALEVVLRKSKEPLTCVEIYDNNAKVRELASSPNRVSDYLGGLWRKGLVQRTPAPRTNNSSARWAYQWRATPLKLSVVGEKAAVEYSSKNKNVLVDRPSFQISEDGELITIDLPSLLITIRTKK